MGTYSPPPLAQQLAAVLAGTLPAQKLPFDPVGQLPLGELDDGELAALLPAALHCRYTAVADDLCAVAWRILDADEQRQPRLSVAVCAAALQPLALPAAATAGAGRSGRPRLPRGIDGVALLARCSDPQHPRLAAPALALLQRCDVSPGNTHGIGTEAHSALALARCAGPAGNAPLAALLQSCAAHPLLLDELRLLGGWPLPAQLRHARIADLYPYEQDIDPAPADLQRLGESAAYLAFARQALQQAVLRLQAIHEGRVPYAADTAFSIAEGGVLWRATRVALEQDAPWLRPLLMQLLPPVCVAPTTAHSLPSQSVALALAKAVNAMPTPEAIAALAQARRQVRHRGIARKLGRHLAAAERRLALRPQLLLRLPDEGTGKRRVASLARALEASFALGGEWTLEDWRPGWRQPLVAALLGALVWQFGDERDHWIDGMAVAGAPNMFANAHGIVVALQGRSRVRLWHPARSEAGSRSAWRSRLIEQRCRQPLRQVFREHYLDADGEPADIATFRGLALAVPALSGLARQRGWNSQPDGQLVLAKGPWQISWQLGSMLSHGLAGEVDSGRVCFQRRSRETWQPVEPRELPPVVASELLRELDLLASACACGHKPTARPPARMVRLRGRTLEQLFAGHPQRPLMNFQRRDVQVGDYRLHLATGRVSLAGQSLPLPEPVAKAGRWVPYDDSLLALLVDRIEQLATLVLTRTDTAAGNTADT